MQVAVAEVGRREIGAEQIRAPQLNALQECAVPVYSDERYPIQVQFLEGFDPAPLPPLPWAVLTTCQT